MPVFTPGTGHKFQGPQYIHTFVYNDYNLYQPPKRYLKDDAGWVSNQAFMSFTCSFRICHSPGTFMCSLTQKFPLVFQPFCILQRIIRGIIQILCKLYKYHTIQGLKYFLLQDTEINKCFVLADSPIRKMTSNVKQDKIPTTTEFQGAAPATIAVITRKRVPYLEGLPTAGMCQGSIQVTLQEELGRPRGRTGLLPGTWKQAGPESVDWVEIDVETIY